MARHTHEANLEVHAAEKDEVYQDLVRINGADRGDIAKGTICRVSVGQRSAYVILRGNREPGAILLDEALRDRLQVDQGKKYDFKIRSSGFLGELRWAWSATDPAYRVAAKLGVLSFWLGILSLVLAVGPQFTTFFRSILNCLGSIIKFVSAVAWN